MILRFKRDFFIWWGCKKLNRLVARERAKSEQVCWIVAQFSRGWF